MSAVFVPKFQHFIRLFLSLALVLLSLQVCFSNRMKEIRKESVLILWLRIDPRISGEHLFVCFTFILQPFGVCVLFFFFSFLSPYGSHKNTFHVLCSEMNTNTHFARVQKQQQQNILIQFVNASMLCYFTRCFVVVFWFRLFTKQQKQ